MQPQRYKRRDYSGQVGPRQPRIEDFGQVRRPPAPKPAAAKTSSGRVLLSIRINLPEYGRWRVTRFAREYPFLAAAGAAGILIALGLLVTLIKVVF